MTSIFWWIRFLETPLRDHNLCWQTPLPPPQLLQYPRGADRQQKKGSWSLLRQQSVVVGRGSWEPGMYKWCLQFVGEMCVSDLLSLLSFHEWQSLFQVFCYLQIIAHKIVHFQWNKLPESWRPREWQELGVLKCVACRVNFLLPV